MILDTHCHIQFKGQDADRDVIIARGRARGLILNLVGTQKETSKRGVELAIQHNDMYASIGTHPNHLFPTYIDEEESHFMSREEDFDGAYYEEIFNLAPDKIIGVGECGLDLFHVPSDVPLETVLEKQKNVFKKHVAFAILHDLPLVIHVRDPVKVADAPHGAGAHEHMIELLKQIELPKHRGTIHCYTGNWEFAQEYLQLGFYLGFTGVITFPAKKTNPAQQESLWEVIRNMPEERIVVETDAPYLAPQAYRGERCEPWMTEECVKKIAELRGKSVEEMEAIIFANTKRLFYKIK
jgi:TatD DNase family protein